MSNEITKQSNTLSALLQKDATKTRLEEILGKRSSTFATSLIQIVNSTDALKKCEPVSVLNAALVATTLDLPINNQLGLAYIIPYGQSATIQLGYRAYIQLAQRSGQFKKINVTEVREGEIIENDRLTGDIKFEWNNTSKRESLPVVGYVAYFELLNGYSHTLYMSKDETNAHAKKYSQTFKKFGSGLWKDEFDSMAKKTVLKLLLSKYAPLSVEMQKAQVADQSIIKDYDGGDTIDVDYVDNTPTQSVTVSDEEKELQRLSTHLKSVSTEEALNDLEGSIPNISAEQKALIDAKRKEIVKATKTK